MKLTYYSLAALFLFSVICFGGISNKSVIASDFPLTCSKTYFGSSDVEIAQKNLKDFDVIFLGTLAKVVNPSLRHNVEFKEENYYVTFSVNEMIKYDGPQKFYQDNEIVLLSLGSTSLPNGPCLDGVGIQRQIGKSYLIFAQQSKEYKAPLIYRVSQQIVLEPEIHTQLTQSSDIIFVARHKETIKTETTQRKDSNTGEYLYSPGGNNLYDSKSLSHFEVVEPLKGLKSGKPVDYEVPVWHEINLDLKRENPKRDYLIFASKKNSSEDYIAHSMTIYIERELRVLRELSHKKSLRNWWRNLWR